MMLKITDLKPQKNDPQRLNVYLDGEFGFGIARAVAPWLKVGDQLSHEKIEELKKADQIERAYKRALHYLSYRSRSKEEVRRNLQKHEVPEAAVEKVLKRLSENGLVDDLAFAQTWVENRAAFHPRSQWAIKAELRQKGVPRKIIEKAVEDVNDHEMAYEVAQNKLRRIENLDRPDFERKLYGYLGRRGFPYNICKETAQRVWSELNEEP
ncbi:MAG: RecX family transcriptional regulator [Anaerolineales bacterium]|nr:RecX family transcriptional regulator [Anaerolineales bacterium]MBS3752622.1 RecX family transcriptional regulator [Anaerolineales bacterium]